MCRPQPVAHPTYLYHTLQSHTSSCSCCDLSSLYIRAYNSFSFVWLYVTCSSRSLCHRRLHHGRSSSNGATADETGLILWIRAHYCSQRVALPREPQQTHTPSSWFGTHAQVGGTGQKCLDDSVHKMRLSVTTLLFSIDEFQNSIEQTLHVSIIRPALYHLATKTIIKQPKEVPFVVGIITVEVLTSLTTVVVPSRKV
jgi:hypothetical protein